MTTYTTQAARIASGLAIALLAIVALSACSGSEPAARTEAAQAEPPVQRPSSASLPSGNADAGEKLANTAMGASNKSCIQCHGAQGNHPDDMNPPPPKIGGQYDDYIAHALQAYRAGERTNTFMVGQAKDLSDQQIADLAAYFSAQPSELNDLSEMK